MELIRLRAEFLHPTAQKFIALLRGELRDAGAGDIGELVEVEESAAAAHFIYFELEIAPVRPGVFAFPLLEIGI